VSALLRVQGSTVAQAEELGERELDRLCELAHPAISRGRTEFTIVKGCSAQPAD